MVCGDHRSTPESIFDGKFSVRYLVVPVIMSELNKKTPYGTWTFL